MPVSRHAVHAFLDRELESYTWLKDLPRRKIERELAALRMRPEFKTNPWLHQLVCFWIGLCEPRFLFLLDMGLGKSKIIADLITHAFRERRLRRGDHALQCVPRLINVDSWVDDLAKHSNLEPWCINVENIEAKRDALMNPKGEVTLIDYAGLHLACCDYVKPGRGKGRYVYNEDVIERVARLHPFLGLDESHMLANPDSLWFGITRRLAERANNVYATTGTLFGKHVESIWPQFFLVDGGDTFGENMGIFRAAFFETEDNPWKGVTHKFIKRMDRRLHRMLQHRSIRYDESEVPEIDIPAMPPPIVRTLDMGVEQREHYMNALEGLINAEGTLAALDGAWTRMRMIASGYLAWRDENGEHVIRFKHNPKLEETCAILDACPDDKVVIVHYYTETGALITDRLKALGISHLWLYGGSKDPGAIRRAFMDPRGPRVLVMNSVAGGTGNDGLQEAARYMVMYETPTNPSDRRQVIKRLHRPGQKRRVMVYDPVLRRSLDRGILDDIAEGLDTYQRVVNGSSQSRNFFLR